MELLQSMLETMNAAAYRPSNSEREVLSLVVKSDTPAMAYAQVSQGHTLVAARDKLIRLGLLTYHNNGLELSSTGQELVDAQAIESNPVLPNEG